MSNYMETYKQWCTDPYFDADTKAELKKIEGDQACLLYTSPSPRDS